MADLSTAKNCIDAMIKEGIYKGERVGRVTRDIGGITSQVSGFPIYNKGQIVLFRQEEDLPEGTLSTELLRREYEKMGKKMPNSFVTVESPLSPGEIAKQRERGSLITTVKTTVGVPRNYITYLKYVKKIVI
ncbi:MAG: hypothetical protein AABW50_01490 [Nanoarchaeota archaeon]